MLYLHIGSEKTGSTSIQWLLRMGALEATTDVRRLRPGPEWGQMTFVRALAAEDRRRAKVLATLGDLATRVNAEPSRTWVFTNEVLFRRGVAASLAEGLGRRVSVPVKVICYLRRPDFLAEALYKQRVKNGRIAAGPAAFLARARDALDFEGILGEYAAAFGAENLVVRPFERQRFPEGNVVLDFLSLIGIEPIPEGIETTLDRNRSLSTAASEFAGLVARTNGSLHKRVLTHLNRSENPLLHRSCDAFTLAERRAIMADAALGLERVRQAYLPQWGRLFDVADLAEEEADPYPSEAERLHLTRAAAEETIRALAPRALQEGKTEAAAAEQAEEPGRAPRPRRRAARLLAATRAAEAAGEPLPRRARRRPTAG